MEPVRIGRYEIHEALGQGGMGTVYQARDPMMDRWVALKTITVQDATQRARFRQEVQAAGKLNHPHIITIYDVGEAGDLAYIVMELVEGDTLASRLSAPVPWSEAISLLLPICHALVYAHSQGVIHRDVKPANILISTSGQVKLTDFGVARLEAALRRITESGSTVGTPLYTAPEQIRNEMVDGRADLFSLGIVLYELITTQHPFIGENLAQVVYRITQAEPANLEPLVGMVPPTVVEVVARALNKDPAARFAHANDMALTMTACLEQKEFLPTSLPARPLRVASSSPRLPTSSPLPILDVVASNLSLSPAEEALLRGAFAGYDRVFLEREFSSGYSGSRVLLATPVRSGRRLAQLVLKLGSAAAVEREWQAYQEFVKDTLPPVTARIMEEPLRAKEGPLALLQYNFAGGLGHIPPESLRTYYAHNSGEEVATLLEKGVFRAFGSKWWLQRRATDLIFRREYDRLLPVHLVVERQDLAEATATPRLLVAGKIGSHAFRQLDSGQLVQLQGFTVEEVQAAQGEVTLQGLPPSGSSTNPIRVRAMGLPPHSIGYQVGQRVPALIGLVTATRHDLLLQSAQPAFPDQDLTQKNIAIGGQPYPNPLYDYDSLLDQHVSAMTSIIHGDLNLDNILVTPTSRLAWLIDFATTRDQGHNLYDFMRLETQVITKLLAQTRLGPEAAARLMQALHQAEASRHQLPPELQKPFTVLAAIRRMVRVCMYNRENWDEYYLGLTLMLLGSLKFKELDSSARGLALAAAATIRGLITIPALRVTPPPTPAPVSQPSSTRPKVVILAVGAVVLLVIIMALAWWVLGLLPSANPPPPTATAVVAVTPPAPTHTWTPTVTPFPSPTVSVEGVVFGSAEIRSGPGAAYPALGSVPIGNRVQVTGRSADGAWLQIEHPGGPGGSGWLPVDSLTLVEPVTPPVVTANPPPPSPTSPPTAEPVVVVTPKPSPCAPPTYYADLPAKYPGLGCAVESWQSDFTFQRFEQGLMVWRKTPAPAQIYILYDNGKWQVQEDPQGLAQPACREAEQTDGLGSILSFGQIWCAGEKDRLGLPVTGEIASDDSPVEEFEHGLAFTFGQSNYILLDDDRWESFSPSLSAMSNYRFFFAIGSGDGYHFYKMNLGDRDPTPLTNELGEGRPALAPDGQTLAFASSRSGASDIFLLNLNTQEVTQLTFDPEQDHTPAWSPDGQRIAFQSKRAGNYDIYLMDADGSNQIALTDHPADDYWPTWSPDGTQIRFESRRDGRDRSQLYLMDADGSNQTRLIESSGNDGTPAWSPTGAMAFYSDRDGNRELYLMDSLKAPPRRLTENSIDDWFPVWSSDGRYLAYTSGNSRQGEIYVLDTTNQSITQLAQNSVDRNGLIIGFAIYPPQSVVSAAPPTATPGPPLCSISPASEFQFLWSRYYTELGCPVDASVVIPTLAEELFEGGHMFWRKDTDEVYIVYDRGRAGANLLSGNWENYRSPWDGSNADGVGLSPPPGRVEPERGFGWLWRTKLGGPDSRLGWALDKEYGFDNIGRAQSFEKGFAFKGSDQKVYALLNDGRFLSYDPRVGQQVLPPSSGHSDTGFQPADNFTSLWGQLGDGNGLLGYPLGAAITDRNYARQPFERGFMFWWEALQEPQPIWVIYTPDPLATSGETWTKYDNRWQAGQPEFPADCPQAGPPLGPKNGFGLVWCYEARVTEQVGQPRDLEFGSGNTFPKGALQFFQGGVMFENPADRQVWALIDGDGWYRLNY